jgi:hypothetical protein
VQEQLPCADSAVPDIATAPQAAQFRFTAGTMTLVAHEGLDDIAAVI